MSLLVVIVALLLAGALGLLYFPWSGKGAVDRDALNRALYQSRLQELAQERGEDNPALVVELQRTLLTDTPPQPLRRTAAKPLGVVSGRAAAGGPESGPVSENQRYWPCCSGSRLNGIILRCCSRLRTRRRRRCEWMSWRSCGLACAATCRIPRTTSPAGSCLGGWACC